ncbi:uncharacterized protein LOC114527628 [Dendronephthya gigantea]|uniref:uncharacterized protein LOC114527628 n=1 Tax=Dendronephthya gigantea TaxID=151771 RepID=UPI00106BD4E1|nr:uncharacterized protein LOC114527628 [Dendronephthya gigantea]
MNSRLIFALGFLLMAGLAMAETDEYNDYNEYNAETEQKDETAKQDETKAPKKEETSNDEETKVVLEDMNTQTSTELVQNDDPDAIKHKGLCHWHVGVWYKPGFAIRCSCMRCVCKPGGVWACDYHFAYCPYFYCGNQIYNPHTSICCCGKVYSKNRNFSCCGYFYYDRRLQPML